MTAGVRLADERGLDAVTMRSLAAVLMCGPMSLYNHISNRDDLIDAMTDGVVAEFQLPKPGEGWKAEMAIRCRSAHEVLLQHRWALVPLVSRVNTGPAMLAYVEATLACLAAAGLSLPLADHAWNLLDAYTYGYTLQEISFPFAASEYQGAAAGYLEDFPVERYPVLARLAGMVASGEHSGLQDFDFGLELILAGLEARHAPQGGKT